MVKNFNGVFLALATPQMVKPLAWLRDGIKVGNDHEDY